jgi:hypothetical protein
MESLSTLVSHRYDVRLHCCDLKPPARIFPGIEEIVEGFDEGVGFYPMAKGQQLHASLYVIVRRANPVAGGWWFRGSRRKFVGENLSPGEREKWFPLLS